MVTLQRDIERLIENELETEALVARLQERNAKLERVAKLAKRYTETGFITAGRDLIKALKELDE